MSYFSEPTEELFDNLMKGLNNSKEDYSNSDGESDEVYEKEDLVDEKSIELDPLYKSFSPTIISTHVESDNTPLSKTHDALCESETNVNGMNFCINTDETNISISSTEPNIHSNDKAKASSSAVAHDSTEELGVALDPMETGVFESVETVTIDVNEMSQDEYTICSNMNGDVESDFTQNRVLDSCLEAAQITNKDLVPYSQSAANVSFTLSNVDSNCGKISVDDSEVLSNLQENILANDDSEKTVKEHSDLSTYQYVKSLHIFSHLLCDTKSKMDKNVASSFNDDSEETKLGCRSYHCGGCHSKFWVLRFYYHHLRRVTTKILYDCKKCKQKMKFTNPCLLKLHMQSHGDSIDKIKILESDLTVETPNIMEFKDKYLSEFNKVCSEKTLGTSLVEADSSFECPQCRLKVESLVEHLTYKPAVQGDNYRCHICKFLFTSKCSFDIHLRLHGLEKPYCCPECGTSFVTQSRLLYHVYLECYHFCRREAVKCEKCNWILPSKKAFHNHWMFNHRTLMYKCKFCFRIFHNISNFNFHVEKKHQIKSKQGQFIIYNRCELCSSDKPRVFPRSDYNHHLNKHTNDKANLFYCFECSKCSYITQNPLSFQYHMETMSACRIATDKSFKSSHPDILHPIKKRKCPEFKNKIISKKIFALYSKEKSNNQISMNQDKRSRTPDTNITEPDPLKATRILCLLCSRKFHQLDQIRSHIISYHKCEEFHKYVQISCDVKESPSSKIIENDSSRCKVSSTSDSRSSKRKDIFSCPSCDYLAESKEDFQNHVVIHREDGAYQCLECGECFVCKNPLEIHLVSVHSIKDTSSYILSHYVHNSLPKPCDTSEELQPNQCSVCFDIFPNDKALHLHFRSHGMAFLRQSFAKRIST